MTYSAMPAAPPAITANLTPSQQLNARFTAIYRTHQPRITTLVLSQVRGSDYHLAEDLTAAAFYRAWLDLHQCRATTDIGMYAWLARIARHTVGQYYRVARSTREAATDLNHRAYSNRAMAPSGAVLAPLVRDNPGDCDPDMDEALRRVRAGRQTAGAR